MSSSLLFTVKKLGEERYSVSCGVAPPANESEGTKTFDVFIQVGRTRSLVSLLQQSPLLDVLAQFFEDVLSPRYRLQGEEERFAMICQFAVSGRPKVWRNTNNQVPHDGEGEAKQYGLTIKSEHDTFFRHLYEFDELKTEFELLVGLVVSKARAKAPPVLNPVH